jgi:prevent-host-death family protein
MTTVTIHAAKTHLSKLIERAERGEEVIIARGKTPVARLVPYLREQPKRALTRCEGAPRSVRNSGSHCPRRS